MDLVTLNDLLLDREAVEKVRDWLLHGSGVMVLTQEQTGCGVSTMISLLLDQLQDRVHAIDTTDTGTAMSVLGQKKVIVLDPFEAVLGDQTMSKHLATLLTSPKIPILIAGFKRRITISKLEDMLKRCKSTVTRLTVRGIRDDAAHAYLASLGCKDARGVWERSDRDLRHAVLSLRSSHMKEHLPDGIDGLRAVLEGAGDRTYADMVRVVENDPTIMLDGLFENYIGATPDIHVTSTVMDTICAAEIFAAQKYASTCHDMQPELYGTLAGLGFMNLKLRKPIEKYGTYWARENHRHTKKALCRRIAISGAHAEDLPFIRNMLYADPESQAPKLATLYGEKELWDITRLWTQTARAAQYTSSRHASLIAPDHPPKRQKKRKKS